MKRLILIAIAAIFLVSCALSTNVKQALPFLFATDTSTPTQTSTATPTQTSTPTITPFPTQTLSPTLSMSGLPDDLVAFRNSCTDPFECARVLLHEYGWRWQEPEGESRMSPAVSLQKKHGVCFEFALLMYFGLKDKGFDHYLLALDDTINHGDGHMIDIFQDDKGRWGYIENNENYPSDILYEEPQFNSLDDLFFSYRETHALMDVQYNEYTVYTTNNLEPQRTWITTTNSVNLVCLTYKDSEDVLNKGISLCSDSIHGPERPLPTPTRTPITIPTKTPNAVIPTRAPAYPTADPNLPYDLTIKVFNNCQVQDTVYFYGPTTLKYVVAPGETKELQAPKGIYTFSSNCCGTSTRDLFTSIWTLTLCSN